MRRARPATSPPRTCCSCCDGLGIETGVDLERLVDAAAFISGVLGRKPVSRTGNALLAKRAAEIAKASAVAATV